MTLSLYLARRFLRSWLIVLAVFLALLFVVDLVEQLRRLAQASAGLREAMLLAALNLPNSVYRILPLITLIAAIATFMGLSRSSELVAARAAGRSGYAILAAPMVTALLVGGLTITVLNPISAATAKRYDLLSYQYQTGQTRAISVSKEGLWLRQGGAEGQSVIHARQTNDDGTDLRDATFLTFDAEGAPLRRIAAETAVLADGAWSLTGVKDWPIGSSDNPERDARHLDSLTVSSDLTAEEIRQGLGKMGQISIWDLPAYIDRLERAGFSARRHLVWFQMELAMPLFFAAMVVLAGGFTMRHARSGGTGLMVLLALASGLGFFFLRNFALVLGESGQIPVFLSAWSTPVAAMLAALGLLLHMEHS